jgi:hypothetical protein
MTATIIAFPTLWERDDAEFCRKGTSNYTRACASAVAGADDAETPAGRVGLEQRIHALKRALEHLARYRPDDLGDLILLNDGREFELREMPSMLLGMCRDRGA